VKMGGYFRGVKGNFPFNLVRWILKTLVIYHLIIVISFNLCLFIILLKNPKILN
jgi:hypothetical protein